MERPKTKSKEMGPIMFLSLFLLLLAFFILLNVLSTFEEAKARMVIKSVTSTFKTELINRTKAQIFISTVGPIPDASGTIDELEKLWVAAVPITKSNVLNDGRTMQMTLPKLELYVPGELSIRSDRVKIIQDTVSALEKEFDDGVIEMQFMLGVDDVYRLESTIPEIEPQEEASFTFNPEVITLAEPTEDNKGLAFGRAGVAARMFTEFGAPSSSVSVGFHQGNSKNIQMRFYVRPPEDAYNTFEKEEGPLLPSLADPDARAVRGSVNVLEQEIGDVPAAEPANDNTPSEIEVVPSEEATPAAEVAG